MTTSGLTKDIEAPPPASGRFGDQECSGQRPQIRGLARVKSAPSAAIVGPVSGIDGDGGVGQSRGAQDCGFELLDHVTITLEPGVAPSRSRARPVCGVVIFSVPLLLVIFHFW